MGSKKTITEVRYNKATKVSKIKIVGLAIYRSARSMSTCIPRCAIDKFVELELYIYRQTGPLVMNPDEIIGFRGALVF